MKTVRRITAYCVRRRWLFVIAAVIYVASSLPHVAIPRLLGTAIDEALTGGVERDLMIVGGVILLVALLRVVLVYTSILLGEVVAHRVAYDLRKEYFHKLQGLSLGFYDRRQTGDLMSRATVDVEAIGDFITYALMSQMSGLTIFVTSAAIMLSMDWRLGLITFAFIPVLVWVAARMNFRMAPLYAEAHDETGKMNAVVQENLAGVRVVKAFGAREHEAGKFARKARAVAAKFYAANRIEVAGQGAIELLFAAATGAILYFGGREVFRDG